MTAIQDDRLQKIYAQRRAKLAAQMKKYGITAAIFEDTESRRDACVRYFTGHPADALFIFFDDEKNFLIPWDENTAKCHAHVDNIIAYSQYERQSTRAVKAVLNSMNIQGKLVAELPDCTPYPLFLQYIDTLSGWDVRCRENSLHQQARSMRAIKDDYEVECIKNAARVTDKIIDLIEEKIRSGDIKTETDAALFIEAECRKNGCEKTGFDTLAAGGARSFAIHCFPNYTDGQWPTNGLSILDFGVVYDGYTSDVTLTVAKGKLSAAAERQIKLVQKAYDECLKLYKKDVPIIAASAKAEEIFSKAKRAMPHSLGHGIGLEIHEEPFVSKRSSAEKKFIPGMVVTLEPGLYNPITGGVRLENDILITEEGNTALTHSRIIRM